MSNGSHHTNQLYPVFLKLEQLQTLVVGAGNIALEKLTSLLNNSPLANITVVAPVVKDDIRQLLSEYANCTLQERIFLSSDLEGKHFVICATGKKELNLEIKNKAAQKNIITNVADTPELCDAYLGSIVQRGNLKIAISTNGKSPTIAKRIKEQLHEMIPDEMGSLLNNMQLLRDELKENFKEKIKRLNEITSELLVEKVKDISHDQQ
jgi:siroheme synthase-like protein